MKRELVTDLISNKKMRSMEYLVCSADSQLGLCVASEFEEWIEA